jgi:hypothetical protein
MSVLHGWPLHIFVFNMPTSIAMLNATKKGSNYGNCIINSHVQS